MSQKEIHINKTFDLYCEVCVKTAQLSDNTTCLRDCHKVAVLNVNANAVDKGAVRF